MYCNSDVVFLILDHYGRQCWQRDYPRLARISSEWLGPVRQRLYAHPLLFSHAACYKLARTLQENPALTSTVRSLNIRPKGVRGELDLSASVSILLSVTSLESLTIAGELAVNAERWLRSIASPHTIRFLRIEGDSPCHPWYTEDASLEWSSEFAERFCSLKSLNLHSLTIDIDDSFYDHPGRAVVLARECMLEELHLSDITFSLVSGPLSALLSSSISWKHLKTLTIDVHEDDVHALDYIALLEIVQPSLESFTIRGQGRLRGLNSALSALSIFLPDSERVDTNLMSLPPFHALHNLRFIDAHLVTRSLPILEHAFPNVEELEIFESCRKGPHISLVYWTQTLGAGRFSRLKKLSVTDTSSRSEAGLSENMFKLQEACGKQDVQTSLTIRTMVSYFFIFRIPILYLNFIDRANC